MVGSRIFLMVLCFNILSGLIATPTYVLMAADHSETTASLTTTALPIVVEVPSSPLADPFLPISGEGYLQVTIESFVGYNFKRTSQLAQKVELWLGDKRLASLDGDDQEVINENKRRLFVFPKLNFSHGFYFITARCYGPAALYGRQKWHGETFQVGIHPGKTSRIVKRISFFHW